MNPLLRGFGKIPSFDRLDFTEQQVKVEPQSRELEGFTQRIRAASVFGGLRYSTLKPPLFMSLDSFFDTCGRPIEKGGG